ncbi:hypothetical protein PSHT_15367 [Puccinia striiformis]|uniref:Uncharacterized protein n=1 Tax=Puccinia striiformis TaxID=27350 RepID=A0A2S4UFY9_9BASI|nr:hypothetical protein PSHT_15367 [Puccinia striiformis]
MGVQGVRPFDCNNQVFKDLSCVTLHKRPKGQDFYSIDGAILVVAKGAFEAGCRSRNGVPGCCNDGPRTLNPPIQQHSMHKEYPTKPIQLALQAGVVVTCALRTALLTNRDATGIGTIAHHIFRYFFLIDFLDCV